MAKDPTTPKTGGIHAPVTPSAELAVVVGSARLPRSEVISKVWAGTRHVPGLMISNGA